MISLAIVRSALPPFRDKVILIKDHQTTDDIVNQILKSHTKYESDYDRIYHFFDTGDIYSTCREIWQFLKYNLRYKAETDGLQSVRSPSAILGASGVDCKHYSLFAGGIISAIVRNEAQDFNWCYRFVSYRPDEDVSHVFVVVYDGNDEIWIDPVLSNFDEHKKYSDFIDKSPMALVQITGIGDTGDGVTATVNKQVAWTSFLMAINENLFSIRELLKSNPMITNGALKIYCQSNGFDFNQVQNFLAANPDRY